MKTRGLPYHFRFFFPAPKDPKEIIFEKMGFEKMGLVKGHGLLQKNLTPEQPTIWLIRESSSHEGMLSVDFITRDEMGLILEKSMRFALIKNRWRTIDTEIVTEFTPITQRNANQYAKELNELFEFLEKCKFRLTRATRLTPPRQNEPLEEYADDASSSSEKSDGAFDQLRRCMTR